ncbi:MAG TPA: hypothetical protein VJQ59_09090 [Candidatus Sulfotelmatobacter sp.]|nr:hypothetical protein [Candidatus Sulfotelmatobacter sp.]
MRLLVLILAVSAAAQSTPHLQTSHTTESLRGISAVSQKIIWASGTHGTYLRTIDAGRTWTPAQVPGATALDFRGVVAFSADEAFLMSSGPGDQSRIYHTTDAGQHWQLQFTNTNPKGFFDSIAFWDPHHGIALGDPVPDENGRPKFELLVTDDGKTWHQLPPQRLPEALEGEGAFAASNSCLAILSSNSVVLSGAVAQAHHGQLRSRRPPSSTTDPHDPNIWFATGGKTARVFHSSDNGRSWQVFDTPIIHGPDSAGIFSIAFRNATDGVIAGGDYKHPAADGPNLAFTHDGGKTWHLSEFHPQAYFSAATYGANNHLLVLAQDSILEFGSSPIPRRLSLKNNPTPFNAIAAFQIQGAIAVGAKGAIAAIQ